MFLIYKHRYITATLQQMKNYRKTVHQSWSICSIQCIRELDFIHSNTYVQGFVDKNFVGVGTEQTLTSPHWVIFFVKQLCFFNT